MVSNKVLSYVLLALIVVTIGGVISLLSVTAPFRPVSYELTGKATSASGNVSINIQQSLSITTADGDTINFGDCTPQAGTDSVITSEDTLDTPTVCSSFNDGYGNNADILVRNDGNIYANVTINASDYGEAHGGSFIPSSSGTSWLAYKTLNSSSHPSYNGGCMGSLQSSYTNITNTSYQNLVACTNLSYGTTNNSFQMEVEAMIPNDALIGSSQVVFTFEAHNA